MWAEPEGDPEDDPAEGTEEETPEAPGEDELPAGEEPPQLLKLTLPKKLTLGVKEKVQLQPIPEPLDAAYSLKWKSSDRKIVRVSKSGLVTGVRKGRATITVTAENGVKAKVRVVVKRAPKKLTLKADRTELEVGQTAALSCKLPWNCAGGYSCALSKKKVASLDEDGVLTALKPGMVTVTATAYNGVSASLEITVLPRFEITFLNVGRNDGILIRCDGEYAFIDSGLHSQGERVSDYMRQRGIDRLKYYICSHGHEDHIGGGTAILAALEVDEVLINRPETEAAFKSFAETDEEEAAVERARYRVARVGETYRVGSAELRVLGPVNIRRVSTRKIAENNNCLILRLSYGKSSFLLTGDGSGTEFKDIEATNPGALRSQVYKNAHHYGRVDEAVEFSAPEIVVFSTSADHLPSSDFISSLKRRGCTIYITAPNRNGSITMTSNGGKLTVTTER